MNCCYFQLRLQLMPYLMPSCFQFLSGTRCPCTYFYKEAEKRFAIEDQELLSIELALEE